MCFRLVKWETQKFVEEELSNISMPEMSGKEGNFQYTINEYVVPRNAPASTRTSTQQVSVMLGGAVMLRRNTTV